MSQNGVQTCHSILFHSDAAMRLEGMEERGEKWKRGGGGGGGGGEGGGGGGGGGGRASNILQSDGDTNCVEDAFE